MSGGTRPVLAIAGGVLLVAALTAQAHGSGDADAWYRRREDMASADRAIGLAGDRPEGHFRLAANIGELARSFGLPQA